MNVTLLAIESSCDETSASILENGIILSNVVASQKVHEQYGGVVPELASRAHLVNIIPVIEEAFNLSRINRKQLNAIAFTAGPGLIGSLMVGSSFAKSLALAWNIRLISVHHMQAHVLANFIVSRDDVKQNTIHKPAFPFLCLTVSGGHTQIVLAADYLDMKIVGETNDDAAGEAFDKTAKLLGLPYPGGPLIDTYAKAGDPKRFSFPEPKVPGLDFSFSGLKTSILYFLRDQVKENPDFIRGNLNDICASVQSRIASILINKLEMAALQFGINEIAIAGGVSANSGLRKEAQLRSEKNNWNLYIPRLEYCTDNAAMIAMVGYYKYIAGDFASLDAAPQARMEW
ncbi:MAG: tRNA (adenosine(37)-N6)-threonylcarbamoyltransferase complex transferase subunit TsaD [Chitinophagales bacterium]|nr:tRNA (adenosine(37)-N6)-threonylcarbamoyltransferase complex transferase subunit TsaD [Chitinophagales bacterium]